MHRFARSAGALVAAVAFGGVASPAQANSTPSTAPEPRAASAEHSAVEPEATEFEPRRCAERSYFHEHRFECSRHFRDLEERADRRRERERFADRFPDGNRPDRDSEDRRRRR